jgi:hypothetical protein
MATGAGYGDVVAGRPGPCTRWSWRAGRWLTGSVHWIVDGNNVMGAGGDGWWNDPVGAAVRLTQTVAEWTRTHDDDVTVVFDGRPEPRLAELAGGALTVDFARRSGRDAADDRIVELVELVELVDGAGGAGEPGGQGIGVVTSDRGLARRLPVEVTVEGAGSFRTRIGIAPRRRPR